ncbi:hypothetical protein ANO14919_132510 [Xylariales sp. No.14919]|nr:hypothetical protein ANO14919_132510 [Xylariales sp. No.14919]
MAEAGWYVEQSVFGGRLNIAIFPGRSDSLPPLTLYSLRWPSIERQAEFEPADSNGAYLQEGAVYITHHIPSTWPSKLLSEAFWNSPDFPRKSDNFFHNPRLFRSTSVVQDGELTEVSEMRAIGPNQRNSQYPETKALLEDWTHLVAIWSHIRRPWFGIALRAWGDTPWWNGPRRDQISLFADAFAKKSHVQCATIADDLLQEIPWGDGRDEYLQHLPENGNTSSEWAWHAIGLLMLASLPLRHRALFETALQDRSWIVELAPSRDAITAGHDKTVYIGSSLGDDPNSSLVVNASVLYDHTKPDGGEVDDFTQLDYLALITSMIALIAQRGGTLHVVFLDAITHAREALLQDRQRLETSYAAGHSTRWASEWPFKFPEYNPTRCRWDGRGWVKEQADPTI